MRTQTALCIWKRRAQGRFYYIPPVGGVLSPVSPVPVSPPIPLPVSPVGGVGVGVGAGEVGSLGGMLGVGGVLGVGGMLGVGVCG